MNIDRPRLPELGHGGDHVGAKRDRRAFRFFVLATVLFTGVLCFAERYLKYDRAETHYMIALTFEPESARPWLRHAVKEDERTHEVPTPKYVQALAAREEDDLILPTYEKAFKLDPANAGVAIRYGCRLALAGQIEEAIAKFEAASANDPQNALPAYLKAAVLAGKRGENQWLSESLTLVAQANYSGKKIEFPRPLWFSELPQRGVRYAELCREIVNEGVAPLLTYADAVVAAAQADLTSGEVQHWDSWLETLQQMGARIVESAGDPEKRAGEPRAGVALQAIAGIYVQRTALAQRIRVAELRHTDTSSFLEEQRRLEKALTVLTEFENRRDETIARDRASYALAGRLIIFTALGLLAAFACFYAFWHFMGRRILQVPRRSQKRGTQDEPLAESDLWTELAEDPEWTIRHPMGARAVFSAIGLIWFGLLVALAVIQRTTAGENESLLSLFETVWWAFTLSILATGLFYAAVVLPSASSLLQKITTELGDEKVQESHVRSLRRRAVWCLRRRYYGILLGTFWTSVALWILAYRIGTSLYPWQVQLLTTGLSEAEAEAVTRAVSLLS